MTTRSYAPTSLSAHESPSCSVLACRKGKGAHDAPGGNLNVVVALHDVHVQLALCRRQEDPLVNLDLEYGEGTAVSLFLNPALPLQ